MIDLIRHIFDTAFIDFLHFCGVTVVLAIIAFGCSDTIIAVGKSINLFIMALRGIPVDMSTIVINKREED